MEKLVPMVVRFTGVEDDELREYCFQAFEAFICRYARTNALTPRLTLFETLIKEHATSVPHVY